MVAVRLLIATMMNFLDVQAIGDIKTTREGFLTAVVRVARTGIQQYTGAEMGRPDLATVNVYRPEAEVFNRDAINSFANVTLTIDHPTTMVDSKNWREVGVGETTSEILRDGEFVRVPLMLRDAQAIDDVQSGRKREVSAGYTAEIEWTDGVTPDGLTYQAIQKNIRVNHISVVGQARGGSSLTIGDTLTMPNKTIMFDGLPIETTDAGEAVINKLVGVRDAQTVQITALTEQVKTLTDAVSTKDGEIVLLNKKVADAVITPAMLDSAVVERQTTIDAAKSIVPNFDATGKSIADIKKAVATVALGDAAQVAAMDEATVNGVYLAATKGFVKDAATVVLEGGLSVVNLGDARAKMEAARANMK